MKKIFRVTKFYHYAEMYNVEAETKEEAKDLVDTGEYSDEDDIYKEFDFYEVEEITE